MKWFSKIRSDKYVLQQYSKAAAEFADAFSYIIMVGECIGFEKLLSEWAYWEKEVANRGYITIPVEVLEILENGHSGFRRQPNDPPIYHAERYRERWLGKQLVFFEEGSNQGTATWPTTSDPTDAECLDK
jgi:hypothetical protein